MALPVVSEGGLAGAGSAPPSLHNENGKEGFFSIDTRCLHSLLAPLQDAHCFTQVLSAALSAVVLVGGSLVKLPQLLKITRAKGVEGLSELSVFVEAFSASVFVGYNILERHPFATWGEMLFVAAQNLCILMLFWRYRLPRDCLAAASKEKSETARQASKEQGGVLPLSRFSTFSSRERLLSKTVLLLHFTLLAYARLAGEKQTTVFARTLATVLGVAPFPLLFLSRLPQIRQNWVQQHTGQLSTLTGFLMLCGNLARLFTSLVSLSDSFVTLSCLLASILNAIPLFQIYWYRKNTRRILASQHQDHATGTLKQKLG